MLVGIKNRIKNNWVVLVILLLGSFLFISASPLYKGNPWVDTNAMLGDRSSLVRWPSALSGYF